MEKGEIPNDIISQQNERIQEYIKQRKWKLVKKYSDRKKEEFELGTREVTQPYSLFLCRQPAPSSTTSSTRLNVRPKSRNVHEGKSIKVSIENIPDY